MASKGRPRREKAEEDKAATGPFPLAEEIMTYEAHLQGWADREGQFVLIKCRDVLGFYPRHEDALDAGYDRLVCGTFLVKQILVHEPIYQPGRVELSGNGHDNRDPDKISAPGVTSGLKLPPAIPQRPADSSSDSRRGYPRPGSARSRRIRGGLSGSAGGCARGHRLCGPK